MTRFKVNHGYHYRQHHLLEGEVVELSAEDADFVMRDASSCLEPVADDMPLVSAADLDAQDAEAAARTLDVPNKDRMVRRPREKRHLDRDGDPESGSTGAMSGKAFGGKGE